MSTAFQPLGLSASFGFGDRLGMATPGHVLAMRRDGDGMAPIFAQQSIREMTRTNRTPQQVVADALAGAADWNRPHGADADHLKTTQDIDTTLAAGFTFFTIDPSAEVDVHAAEYSEFDLRARFLAVRNGVEWVEAYRGRGIALPDGSKIEFDEQTLLRAAVKYGRAILLAQRLAKHIEASAGRAGAAFEIELSVDETPEPTTPAEHYIIADQLRSAGVRLASLAPRFVGDFEKGVDFKGDLSAFERSLAEHAAIAEILGPYKLSLHSGSDKLSIYQAFARATRGHFHVKTAGTSYLEALRAVLRHDESLFREIVDLSRERYETDRATYHVSATLASTPPPAALADAAALERVYLDRWSDIRDDSRGFTQPGRQILHTAFGSVLTDSKLKSQIMQILTEHRATYDEILAEHFGRHLRTLRKGM